MTKTDSIVEEALHLPRESRALIAEKLLESLDYEEGFEVSQAWIEEIRRRCQDIDEGTATLVSGEQTFKELDNSLG